jgi:hypothetical protein
MNILARTALVGAMLIAPATAPAQPATGSMGISGYVPAVCNIDAQALTVSGTQGRASGTVQEFCNAGLAFVIMASYRPLEPGEQVTFSYDGEISQLGPSGMSAVAFRQGPRLRTVPVSIQSSGLHGGLAVSLAMTAI